MAKKFFIGNTELATSSDVANAVANKQDTLVSGTNIKTINQTSILGSGDIQIAGGLTEVKASDIDSESATSGQVLMADGDGGASWQSVSSGSSNYNELSNKPIKNQDLDDVGFSPVSNTYYRHTGASATTYEIGRIYYYDGTYFNAVLSQNDVETTAVQNSTKPISSGAVYTILDGINARLQNI